MQDLDDSDVEELQSKKKKSAHKEYRWAMKWRTNPWDREPPSTSIRGNGIRLAISRDVGFRNNEPTIPCCSAKHFLMFVLISARAAWNSTVRFSCTDRSWRTSSANWATRRSASSWPWDRCSVLCLMSCCHLSSLRWSWSWCTVLLWWLSITCTPRTHFANKNS